MSFLSLFALLFSLIVGVFVHTDDGCAVERHCQTCVSALNPADGAYSPATVTATCRPTALAIGFFRDTITGESAVQASRGPPSV